MRRIQSFTIETERGTVQVSMRSTGRGAWIAAKQFNPRRIHTTITPVQWVTNANQIAGMLEGSEE